MGTTQNDLGGALFCPHLKNFTRESKLTTGLETNELGIRIMDALVNDCLMDTNRLLQSAYKAKTYNPYSGMCYCNACYILYLNMLKYFQQLYPS